jgi:hypothetical protein
MGHFFQPNTHFMRNEANVVLKAGKLPTDFLWRRLVLPMRIESWPLTCPQQRLVRTGGRLIK